MRSPVPGQAAFLASLLFTLPASARMIDDFEDGDLVAHPGLAWVPITDEQYGGTSHLSLEPRRGTLHIVGRAAKGDAGFLVAGAWVPLDPRGAPVDLTAFDRLRIRIRGRADALEVGFRHGQTSGTPDNRMAPVHPREDWQTIEIPFAELRSHVPAGKAPAWDPRDVWYLGIATAPGAETEVDVEIDEVSLLPAGREPVYAAILDLAPARTVAGFPWRPLADDPAGDAHRRLLPDARSLWYHADPSTDRIWFKVVTEGEPRQDFLGLNVAMDIDEDPANGTAWWGTNREFRFDRLVTAYLFRAGDRWQGSFGVADSAGVARGDMGSLARDEVVFGVDRGEHALFFGVPRPLLGSGPGVRVIATVGSAMSPNDDIPDRGAARLSW